MFFSFKFDGSAQHVVLEQCAAQIDYLHKQCSALHVKDYQFDWVLYENNAKSSD